jgi:ribosomal protein S27AE
MTEEQWDQWVNQHATSFGMVEHQRNMLRSWREAFEAERYTLEELTSASKALLGIENLYPGNHAAAIGREIKNIRAIKYRQESDKLDQDRGQCVNCGGSGMIIVPLIRPGIAPDEWRPLQIARGGATYYTMAVRCSCAKGRFMADHIRQPEKVPMSIETYERHNPAWREQMAQRQEALLKRAQSRQTPRISNQIP